MKTLQRLQLVISCLLTTLLIGGAVLPSPAAWQCRHASRVVNTAFVPVPSIMPCLMRVEPMPPMTCCPPSRAPAGHPSPAGPTFSRLACHPVLICLATLPALNSAKPHALLRLQLELMPVEFPRSPASLPVKLLTLLFRQRPPPTAALSQSTLEPTFGLRAPPAA